MLSLNRKTNINIIFTGSSREDFSLPDNYCKKITNENCLNMGMQSARFNEHKYIIQRALELQPKLKTVLIGVDFDFYYLNDTNKTSNLENYENSKFQNYSTILFSLDALNSSIMTIIKSVNPKYQKGYLPNGMKKIFVNTKIDSSFEQTINQYKFVGLEFINQEPDLNDLKNLVLSLKKRNINVVLFMQPVHSSFYEIIKQNGAWDNILKFKIELASIQPFYDFYYPSHFSNEKIYPQMKYFFESSHCTHIVGEKILDKIFLNKGDFGYLATTDNVIEKHKEHTKLIQIWERENPIWVAKIKEIRDNR